MSHETGIIVQARMSSTRLPQKSLKPIGEHPLIWYVVKRLEILKLPVIVCTSTHSSDDALCDYLDSQKMIFYRGSLHNVRKRYIETAQNYKIENIVRVTGDNAFVDISLLENSLHYFNDYHYVDGIYGNGLINGTGFELVRLATLKSIPSFQKNHLEHVTSWLREHIEQSEKWMQLKPTQENTFRKDIVLTCDYSEDLQLLREIFSHFNYRFNITIPEIIDYLSKNPILTAINRKRHNPLSSA